VLVMEGDVLVRLAIAEHLRDAGYRVIETATGEEAHATLEMGADVDLVFADIDLPGPWQGTQLVGWLRTQLPGIKVILTSCAFHNLVGAGCDGFIAKPYLPTEVATYIETLLGD
jgi:CheY-like chemotaxis protein